MWKIRDEIDKNKILGTKLTAGVKFGDEIGTFALILFPKNSCKNNNTVLINYILIKSNWSYKILIFTFLVILVNFQ